MSSRGRGGDNVVYIERKSASLLADLLHPKIKPIRTRDSQKRRNSIIKKFLEVKAGNSNENAEKGHVDLPHVLMDLDRNILKEKMLSREEAATRNRDIKSLGYAWCQAGYLEL